MAALATSLAAAQVDGIVPALPAPPVVRGEVLLVPLQAERPGAEWPDSMSIVLSDGRHVDGTVVWIGPRAIPLNRRWTDDPTRLAVRPVLREDDTAQSRDGGSPFLLAEMPIDVDGPLRVVDTRRRADGADRPEATIAPRWIDDVPRPSGAATLERIWADDRPDPESPFSHWRWELLAQRLGMTPPEPPAGQIDSLIARHGASLWRVGLARLAGVSPGVAAECLEMLTNTVEFDGRHIAAWVTDPLEIATLLGVLIDRRRSDDAVMEAALAWAGSRDPLTVWLDSEADDSVTLLIANARVEPQTAVLGWQIEGQHRGVPTAIELLGGRIHREVLTRPEPPRGDPIVRRERRPEPMLLALTHGDRVRRMPISPSATIVAPPGTVIASFRPGLRLHEIRTGTQETIPAERGTIAILRRVNRRWELFVECARPGRAGAAAAGAIGGEAWPPRGTEAVTLAFGPVDEPYAVLCVPETEPWWTPVGVPAGLEVHRRSEGRTWVARIVIPQEWLPNAANEPLLLGLARTHGDHDGIEIAGVSRALWHPNPAPMVLDLSRWDE